MGKIYPGKVWKDTEGRRIHAHGGSLLYVNQKFYWYGENKEKTLPGNGIWHNGVNLYSSNDLCQWKYEGIILKPTDDPKHPLHPSRIMDRPHILYNQKDRRYVMWMKLVGTYEQRSNWKDSHMGIAVSDFIYGPFKLIDVIHPLGMNAGDFDLVKDENGKAYIIFEQVHFNLVIADLTDDYCGCAGVYTEHFNNGAPPYVREAPAFFRRNGLNYLLTSGTTGYYPNPSEIAVCDQMHGDWKILGDPCKEDVHKNSFASQFSSVFRHPLKKDLYIALGDRWLSDLPEDMPNYWDSVTKQNGEKIDFSIYTKKNISLADYVWLPLHFDKNGVPYIVKVDEWSPDEYEDA